MNEIVALSMRPDSGIFYKCRLEFFFGTENFGHLPIPCKYGHPSRSYLASTYMEARVC